MPDFFDAMRPSGPKAKVERYSEKIIRRLLRRGDAAPWRLMEVCKEASTHGWARWFNANVSCPFALEAIRVFNFNFFDLLKPDELKRGPVWTNWKEHQANYPNRACALIFHVSDYGEWVLVGSRDPAELTRSQLTHGLFTKDRAEWVLIVRLREFESEWLSGWQPQF